MQEILDIFLEKSKQHHSNIIYAQIYKNDVLKEVEKILQKDWKYSGIMSYNK